MKYSAMRKLYKLGKYVLIVAIITPVIYWVRFTPVSVVGNKVDKGEIIAEVMGTGTLEARIQTVISSKISGRIDRVFFDQGDRVDKGETLLRLDDSELKQQVEIARSALSAASASVERVQTDQTRARIILEQIQSDHARNQKLFANKTIPFNEMEKSEKALSVAEADLDRTKAALSESRKNLIVAQNNLDYQLARLEDTAIKAPFKSLIVRRDRQAGDVVVPGSSIFLLISTEEMWVRAWVDETEMINVAPGQEARVIFRSEPGRSFPGVVVRLGLETDRETREFIADVKVDSLPKNWSVGQRAEVFIKTNEKKDVVLLPARFIIREKDRTGVFIEKDGKAVWRSIRIGLRGSKDVEITDGLVSGDRVITPLDSKRFFNGRKVKVTLP